MEAMTAKTKWTLGGAAAVIIILLVIIFRTDIWNWLEGTMVNILIYLIVFGVGWWWGRYGNKTNK